MSDRNSNVNIHSDNNSNNIGTTIYNFGQTHTDDVIKCEKCNKIFATAQTLKTHSLTINCVKENNTSTRCEYCDKDFSSKQMLTYHNNVCINRKISLLKIDYESTIKQLQQELSSLKNEKII